MSGMDATVAGLDRALGRLSMYRLVTIALGLISVAALGLSITGSLPFDPVALLASAGVLLASTYLAGRLFAAMFGGRQHPESALITALIIRRSDLSVPRDRLGWPVIS